MLKQLEFDDAPSWYTEDKANAWVNGYNYAIANLAFHAASNLTIDDIAILVDPRAFDSMSTFLSVSDKHQAIDKARSKAEHIILFLQQTSKQALVVDSGDKSTGAFQRLEAAVLSTKSPDTDDEPTMFTSVRIRDLETLLKSASK